MADSSELLSGAAQQVRDFLETRVDPVQRLHQLIRGTERRCIALLQRFSPRKDVCAESIRIDDSDQPHRMRLTLTLARSFELEHAQLEVSEYRTFDEGDVLDVLERDGLLDLKQNALAEANGGVRELAFELVVVMARPPLADTEKPDQREWDSDHRRNQDEADL